MIQYSNITYIALIAMGGSSNFLSSSHYMVAQDPNYISIKIKCQVDWKVAPWSTGSNTHLSMGALASTVCTMLWRGCPWKPHAAIQVPVACGHMDGLLLPSQSHASLLSRIIRDLKGSPSVTGTHAGLPLLPKIWVQLDRISLSNCSLFLVLGSWESRVCF